MSKSNVGPKSMNDWDDPRFITWLKPEQAAEYLGIPVGSLAYFHKKNKLVKDVHFTRNAPNSPARYSKQALVHWKQTQDLPGDRHAAWVAKYQRRLKDVPQQNA